MIRYFDRLQNQAVITDTVIAPPQRIVTADWPITVPAFTLDIENGVGVSASDPDNRDAQLRGRLYKCFVQGLWKDRVFWEATAIFESNFVVVPERALVTVWHAYEQIRLRRETEPPKLRIIMPTNHQVVVTAAAMSYTVS